MSYWRRLIFLLLLIISFPLFVFAADNSTVWAHLELGAGNYGLDGHTKLSQAMTVLQKIKQVSEEKNYIDELEEIGHGNYNPEEQYAVLFWTLDELVQRYGEVGIFHVNDLYEDYAAFAAQKLREYASNQKYGSVVIEVVPGDYQLIDPKQTLSLHRKTKYSSVHLKNPEISFYHERIDGAHFYSSEQSREQTRHLLQNLANLSESGLYLFILYHDNFIPLQEQMEFVEKNIFYQTTHEWDAIPYIFPEGNVIEKEIGRVFHIQPSE